MKSDTKWTTEIKVNGELLFQEKLTIEEIEKLQQFIKNLNK